MVKIKKLLKKTGFLKRKFIPNLIRTLEIFERKKNKEPVTIDNVKRVLICRPNHRLGNQLLITPLVQEVIHTFPYAKIDLFLKGNLGETIFENYPSVDKLIMLPKKHFKKLFTYIYRWFCIMTRKYDLVINAISGSYSGRLATQIARTKYRLTGDKTLEQTPLPNDYNHFAKKTIYQLWEYLKKSGIQNVEREIPNLDIKLTDEEKANGKKILKEITQNDKPTIAIYTFATLDKCYASEFWIPFYKVLKKKYENSYTIIEVLPIENVSKINFKAPHFYSRNIRELASVISAIKVFISADCGIMHLASASQIPVLGLFKFDNIEKYEPYGYHSTRIRTQDLNTDDIFREIDNIIRITPK